MSWGVRVFSRGPRLAPPSPLAPPTPVQNPKFLTRASRLVPVLGCRPSSSLSSASWPPDQLMTHPWESGASLLPQDSRWWLPCLSAPLLPADTPQPSWSLLSDCRKSGRRLPLRRGPCRVTTSSHPRRLHMQPLGASDACLPHQGQKAVLTITTAHPTEVALASAPSFVLCVVLFALFLQ